MSADGAAPGLPGLWFDGQRSQAQPVRVRLLPGRRGASLELRRLDPPGAPPLRLSHDEVDWPERWSERRAPKELVVDLRDHGSLQIGDPLAWQQAYAAAGGRASLAERMQTRWPVFLAVLVVAAAALGAFYRWGTPWAATQLTRQVPVRWETTLAADALRSMDAQLLKPSHLPAERQAQLRQRFDALVAQLGPGLQRYRGYAPTLTLSFRAGMGANAFALPGGTIVMTDGLVKAAAAQGLGDDALVGVLAHEIGHVVHRHTTRMIVEQGVLNVGLGLALGDVSNILSVGSSMLTGLAYRRQHEGEADCFAVALMNRAGLPTGPMAQLLENMSGPPPGPAASGKGGSAKADTRPGWAGLLASHPQTAQRALALRQADPAACR